MTHQAISFVKSGIRIVGYGFLCASWALPHVALTLILHGGIVLVVSELVGIWEEVGPWQTK